MSPDSAGLSLFDEIELFDKIQYKSSIKTKKREGSSENLVKLAESLQRGAAGFTAFPPLTYF